MTQLTDLIVHLPILRAILRHIPLHDPSLGALLQASKTTHAILQNSLLWLSLINKDFPELEIPQFIHDQNRYQEYYKFVSLKQKINGLLSTGNTVAWNAPTEESLRALFEEVPHNLLATFPEIMAQVQILESWGTSLDMNQNQFEEQIQALAQVAQAYHQIIQTMANSEHRDAKDRTFLMLAALQGNFTLVKALIHAGADHSKAQQYAALGGHQDVADYLATHAGTPRQSAQRILKEKSRVGRLIQQDKSLSPNIERPRSTNSPVIYGLSFNQSTSETNTPIDSTHKSLLKYPHD